MVSATAAALILLAYPRRQVLSMLRLVPREGLAVCIRARGLGEVWRRCERSEFGRKVGRGEIFPIDELCAADDDFRDEWEDLDTSYWPEVLGRDCIFAVYGRGGGAPPRVALWARVGFRARLFHLWERTRATVCFWRAARVRARRVGGLSVNSIMDRKRGTADFSYALIGDLGIATAGDGEGFWERIAALAERGDGQGRGAEGVIAEVQAPDAEDARGALFADLAALRRLADAWIESLRRVPSEEGEALASAWAPARGLLEGWTEAMGSFALGGRTTAEMRLVRPCGGPARSLSADPLAALAARGGILHAAGRWNPQDLLDRARRRWKGGEVRFKRKGGVTVFPSKHFALQWLGDEWSFLLYLDGRGMLNAAASVALRDRRTARTRLARFLKLADGAQVCVTDGRGGEWTPVKGALGVEEERAERGARWRIAPGAPLEYLYAPVLILRDGRLIVSTADPPSSGALGPSPVTSRAAGLAETGRFILRGGEMDRAAASLRQILTIAGAFVEKGSDRARIEGAHRALGALEWLAPLRELRATTAGGGGSTLLSVSAEIEDIGRR